MGRRLAIGALLAVAAAAARAEDQQCTATRQNTAPQALAIVNELDSRIEGVPPDEANYLQTEYVAVMQNHNLARYSMLTKRPYYAAWRLHASLQHLRLELQGMSGPSYGESLERYQAKRAAFVMTRLAFAVNDLMDYTRVDSLRSPQVLTSDQQKQYSRELAGLPAVFATYISCTVDAIK